MDKISDKKAIILYTTGFLLSLSLTGLAFFAVMNNLFSRDTTLIVIGSLAFVQAVVQLVFFLHLAREEKPNWNLLALLSILFILFIVVFGSIWIMNNLNYNMMMTPEEVNEYMIKESKKGF